MDVEAFWRGRTSAPDWQTSWAISGAAFSLSNVKCQCQNLLRAIENLGIAVVYGIRYYGQGNITEDNYVQFIKHDTISSEYLNQSRNFVQHVR